MADVQPAITPILGFGHPLLDISSNVDAAFLQRYCIPPASCNLAEPSQLSIFEELSQMPNVEFVPGGACMNSIRVARWILNDNYSTFVGCLGDDEFGCILERALHLAGVKSIFQRHDDKPTGTCACLIVERERALLANLGAAVEFSMNHLRTAAVQQAMSEAGIFYVEGFFMNVVSSPDSSIAVGDHCVEHNKLFTFNLSAPYLCQYFSTQLNAILPYVDILFGSLPDFVALAELQGWDSGDMETALKLAVALPKRNPRRKRTVVMTNGSSPTLIVQADAPIQEYPPLRIPEEDIVDTNGAGDSFVGGFLSQIAKGRSLEEAVRVGHAAASIVIQHNGCSLPEKMPAVLAGA